MTFDMIPSAESPDPVLRGLFWAVCFGLLGYAAFLFRRMGRPPPPDPQVTEGREIARERLEMDRERMAMARARHRADMEFLALTNLRTKLDCRLVRLRIKEERNGY